MATFAAAFRELVMPDLRMMCRTQALFVALDQCAFTEASAAVMGHATTRGASKLPDNLILELQDWIDTTILREIDGHAATAEAVRHFTDHPGRGEAEWGTM